MAQLSWNDVSFSNDNSSNGPRIGYFALKNDGDEAIVRFMYEAVDQFDVLTTHRISVNGKWRDVSCPRDPRDPIGNCALCNSGEKVQQRFYVKMIQYTINSDGTVTPEGKVWSRPVSFGLTLKGYLENLGPLSDMVCKVIRHGVAGNMQTTYEVIPNLSKQKYPDNVFVKDTSLFENYNILGRIVMNKSAEEIDEFVRTGSFPMKNRTDVPVQAATMPVQEMPWNKPDAPETVEFNFNTNSNQANSFGGSQQTAQTRQLMPWEVPQATNRPVRTF